MVKTTSLWDIKQTDEYTGDRKIQQMWTFVEKDNSDVDQEYEYVISHTHRLIQEDKDNESLYKEYLQRLNQIKENMSEMVTENKARLNKQAHQEALNESGEYGFKYRYMDDDDKKTIRHFLLRDEHGPAPMIYNTKNASYIIRYLGEKVVGKSAYKFEPVKERYFKVDIKSGDKTIEDIQLTVVPEKVTGKAAIRSGVKPGEVFSSKVYHPKYKKVVRVKSGLYSGKYYLHLDYPKYKDEEGNMVYKNPELFTEIDSNTTEKTVELLFKLIAKTHNRRKNKNNKN